MPSIIIIREYLGRFEVLLQRRNRGLKQEFHWCSPGGRLDPAERATRDDRTLDVEARLRAVRRCALREIVEECGGGSCVASTPRTFILDELRHAATGLVDHAAQYVNAVLPPGLFAMVEDHWCVRLLTKGKALELCNTFVYLVSDANAVDAGWAADWRPRARRPWRGEMDEGYAPPPGSPVEVTHAYAWVGLEHVVATQGLAGVMPGSSMPLVDWDRAWFTTNLAELNGCIGSLQAQHRSANPLSTPLGTPLGTLLAAPLEAPLSRPLGTPSEHPGYGGSGESSGGGSGESSGGGGGGGSGGGSGLGSGGGGVKSGSKGGGKAQPSCRFYATPRGCRNSDCCQYFHAAVKPAVPPAVAWAGAAPAPSPPPARLELAYMDELNMQKLQAIWDLLDNYRDIVLSAADYTMP